MKVTCPGRWVAGLNVIIKLIISVRLTLDWPTGSELGYVEIFLNLGLIFMTFLNLFSLTLDNACHLLFLFSLVFHLYNTHLLIILSIIMMHLTFLLNNILIIIIYQTSHSPNIIKYTILITAPSVAISAILALYEMSYLSG